MVDVEDTGGSVSKGERNHEDTSESKADYVDGIPNGVTVDEINLEVLGDGSNGVCTNPSQTQNGKERDCNNNLGEFRRGDFVWGKNKSHVWWPGQVYDSNDASDIAIKHNRDGLVLVAFLGDGSWSWFSPSQLVSFTDNFNQKSMNSSSKTFLKAVEVALDEVGRVLESKMTCNCVSYDKKDGFTGRVISNFGVRAGVLVPNVDMQRLSVPDYDAAEVLTKVIRFARTGYVDSSLEVAVLRGWLAALFSAKGGRKLPKYCDYDVHGLEDINGTSAEVTDDFSVPIEVPILGPTEEDWLAPPEVNDVKTQEPTTDRIYHRRKQKSVADLMRENYDVNNIKSKKKAPVKERTDSRKSSSSSKGNSGNTRKFEVSESPDVILSKALKTGRKTTLRIEVGVKDGRSAAKPNEISVENDSSKGIQESESASTPRERKKSKYLSPPYISPTWRIGSSSFRESELVVKTPKTDYQNDGDHNASESVSASHENSVVNNLSNEKQAGDDAKMSFSSSDVTTSVNEVLLGTRIAAIDPMYLSKEGTVDVVVAFISAFRSSIYAHGEDNEIYQKWMTGKKRESSTLELGSEEDNVTAKRTKLASVKSSPKKQRKINASSIPEKAEETLHGVKEGHTSLILSFTPRTPLPVKEEIVKIFSKYGNLNVEETNVIKDSHLVQVVYNKEANAQTAFKSAVTDNPFGDNVNYWLQPCSASSDPKKPCSTKATSAESSHEKQIDDFMSDVQLIRQKFDIMGAILENYHSKFSMAEKSGLKDEMKCLMESVETASDKVRVLAERHKEVS